MQTVAQNTAQVRIRPGETPAGCRHYYFQRTEEKTILA